MSKLVVNHVKVAERLYEWISVSFYEDRVTLDQNPNSDETSYFVFIPKDGRRIAPVPRPNYMNLAKAMFGSSVIILESSECFEVILPTPTESQSREIINSIKRITSEINSRVLPLRVAQACLILSIVSLILSVYFTHDHIHGYHLEKVFHTLWDSLCEIVFYFFGAIYKLVSTSEPTPLASAL